MVVWQSKLLGKMMEMIKKHEHQTYQTISNWWWHQETKKETVQEVSHFGVQAHREDNDMCCKLGKNACKHPVGWILYKNCNRCFARSNVNTAVEKHVWQPGKVLLTVKPTNKFFQQITTHNYWAPFYESRAWHWWTLNLIINSGATSCKKICTI